MNTNPPQVHWHRELAAMTGRGAMIRNVFVNSDEAARVATFRRQHRNTDIYVSVSQWMQRARAGPCLLPFFFDVDADDLEVARLECIRAAQFLWDKVGIAPEAMDWRFSGKKGFHGVMPQEVFGEPTTNSDLPIWMSLARRLTREGVKHLDLAVYQASRVLRMPNSINSKSNLYDIPLEYAELRDLKAIDIVEIAKAPREQDSMASQIDCPRAQNWLFKAREWWNHRRQDENQKSQPIAPSRGCWRVPPCVRRIEAATLPDGIRHQVYFELARFYACIGMAPEEASDRLHEIDDRHPIRDPEYIDRVVVSGRKYAGFRGCPNSIMEQFCDRTRCFLGADGASSSKAEVCTRH